MHYNPMAYIHSEKDILKLVTTLIANTKGDGKAGDEFWTKAETLLYCALIGYIHYTLGLDFYKLPPDEQKILKRILSKAPNIKNSPFNFRRKRK